MPTVPDTAATELVTTTCLTVPAVRTIAASSEAPTINGETTWNDCLTPALWFRQVSLHQPQLILGFRYQIQQWLHLKWMSGSSSLFSLRLRQQTPWDLRPSLASDFCSGSAAAGSFLWDGGWLLFARFFFLLRLLDSLLRT